jgi:hypothetical protein
MSTENHLTAAQARKAVRRNLGAGCSRVPVIAVLPPPLERRMVAFRKPVSPVSGKPRLDGSPNASIVLLCCCEEPLSEEEADKSTIVQAALAEFSAVRGEIQSRSAHQWTLVGLSVTVTAAVLGFVIPQGADPRLLLVLPLITPSLGMLFIDHAYNIRNLGSYIGKCLSPLIVRTTGSADLLRYEHEIDRYEANLFLRLVFGLPLTVVFTVMPLGAMVFVIPSLDSCWTWIVWSFGLVLVLSELVLWLLFVFDPARFDPFRNE